MKTVMVTGINGFVGHHLAAELARQGHQVIGTDRASDLAADLKPHVQQYFGNCDLTSPESVAKLPLDKLDAIINLAGLARVGASEGQSEKYNRINIAVHTTIADRLQEIGETKTRVLAVSTGAVYDNLQSMPLTEDSKLVTGEASPYALSKLAMEKALELYRDKGLDVVIVRPFNHIGPGQLGGFLVPDLVSQVLAGDTVVAGDLSTERDYTDVRDVVKAYTLLATLPSLKNHLYNICSRKSVSGQSLLETIVRAAGKKMDNINLKVDHSLLRPHDPKKVVGDNSRLHGDTGWQPTTPLAQTIKDIVSSSKNSV